MIEELSRCSLLTRLRIRQDVKALFAEWQHRFHAAIACHPGFVDIEIFSPSLPLQPEWIIVECFDTESHLKQWRQSSERSSMMKELVNLIAGDPTKAIQEKKINGTDTLAGGVTQVFVTKVHPEHAHAYNLWMGKIHEAEAKAPGFRRVYVQAPKGNQDACWITLLQFDTQANLDRWLKSEERQEILAQAAAFVSSLESHRVTSAFAGWFASSLGADAIPPVWKQTMLILLVLFPVVMLEMKFLSPLTKALNPSLGTFISNAISVTLVSWPLLPFVIRKLRWWMNPTGKYRGLFNSLGILIVATLYLAEILILWNLL